MAQAPLLTDLILPGKNPAPVGRTGEMQDHRNTPTARNYVTNVFAAAYHTVARPACAGTPSEPITYTTGGDVADDHRQNHKVNLKHQKSTVTCANVVSYLF
jgi:hypothetical protein